MCLILDGLLYYFSYIVLVYSSLKDGQFETMEIAPLSSPPELPDVMKSQETIKDDATK